MQRSRAVVGAREEWLGAQLQQSLRAVGMPMLCGQEQRRDVRRRQSIRVRAVLKQPGQALGVAELGRQMGRGRAHAVGRARLWARPSLDQGQEAARRTKPGA
jgi:hypothetical protein